MTQPKKKTDLHEAFPVKTVARMTGLTADVIRAWERRYGVVSPMRGPRGARLYSGADVAHLRLLGSLVSRGRAIGDVAGLETEALRRLAHDTPPADARDKASPSQSDTDLVDQLIAAVQRFDSLAVEQLLGDSLLALGVNRFIERVGAPLLRRVGDMWRAGDLSVAEEHVASSIIRSLFGGLLRLRMPRSRPSILLTAPSGERHELGLSMVALLCMQAGVAVAYTGVDLPAEDILTMQDKTHVSVVGLSVVSGANRKNAVEEIRRLEAALPHHVEIWLGGSDAAEVARALGATRAIVLQSLPAIEREIDRVASRASERESRPGAA